MDADADGRGVRHFIYPNGRFTMFISFPDAADEKSFNSRGYNNITNVYNNARAGSIHNGNKCLSKSINLNMNVNRRRYRVIEKKESRLRSRVP